MNAPIDRPDMISQTSSDWRPPGWIFGDEDEPYTPEDRAARDDDGSVILGDDGKPLMIRGVLSLYDEFAAAGYYTSGGSLTEKGENAKDSQEASDVAHNVKLLRDAWNTHPIAWRLGAKLIGREFTVDPFWNQGTVGLPALVRTMDGISPLDDGMLTIDQAEREIASNEKVLQTRYTDAVCAELRSRIAALGEVPRDFPVNWRAHLQPGTAAAAPNGPHSCTARWLKLCALYGEQEFCCAFVPDNGDGWFQSIGLTAQLVVRLGRVPCSPPPGISIKNGKSSPRGASALCIWIPKRVREQVVEITATLATMKSKRSVQETIEQLNQLLPMVTRNVLLTGTAFRVPMWQRSRAGIQYAVVQRASLSNDEVVDFGLMG